MKLNEKGGLVRVAMLIVLVALSATASAEADPENIIKYRRANMKALGAHMGAMAQIVRGKVDYQSQLSLHADTVAAISDTLTDLFPEGSDFGDTQAKEAVWEKWDAFEKAASESAEASAAFAKAAKGGDTSAVGGAFRNLSDACKDCHKKFREKEDK